MSGNFTTNFAAQQPQIQFYNLNEIASQSNHFQLQFNLGPVMDNATPSLAYMIANEVQAQAQKRHFIRVDMHNYISDNAYANQQFSDLVFVLAMRLGHGMQAQEWPRIETGMQTVVSICCKAYAGAMAIDDPARAADIAQNDAEMFAECKRGAELWGYLQALAAGQADYVPFQRGPKITNVPRSVQMNTAVSDNTVQGAFTTAPVVPHDSGMTQGYSGGRYGKAYAKAFGDGRQLGDEAPPRKTAATSAPAGFGLRFGAKAVVAPAAAPAVAPSIGRDIQIQSAVGAEACAEFDKQLGANDEPLATITIANETVSLMRLAVDGKKRWEPTKIQPYIPAYCARTHRLEYFETKNNGIIAVAAVLTEQQKEIAMNYDLHATNPLMGKPDPKVPTNPVREEAKVLYAAADEIKLNIIIKKDVQMSDSHESTFKTAAVLARRASEGEDCAITGAVINTAVIFDEDMIAKDQLQVLHAAARCKTIKEAADTLMRLDDVTLLKSIEENLAKSITSVLVNELGYVKASVSGRLKSYSDDLEEGIRTAFSEMIYEKFMSRVPAILAANLTVVSAAGAVEYANSVLTDADQDTTPQELLDRTLFLQQNVNIARVNFTADELAIVVPDVGAAILDDATTPAVAAIARAVFSPNAPLGPGLSHENYLLTSDNVRYRLHRGLMAANTYLISKA